ncbi:probable WRKY transcription factor 53 [Andrographis paniculata]|uniref:probable WRKY transcription factor 53 n=1 Tax=Andrographis paniculata TaxID=175694 RepID=UPI0021E795EF|nr:probable WRKY transcription factor 53 [Andrographis paniculata]
MDSFVSERDVKNLVRELSEGREQARQLQTHLNTNPNANANSQSSSSYETRDFLLQRIISSYDQALSMLQHTTTTTTTATTTTDHRPPDSPATDDSDQDHHTNNNSRKRKATPRWTRKVKVSPDSAIEGQLDDGYGWRKYGQKDILGAKHPRGYYRCTNRHGQGCMATKQVQRSDEDPTVFVITYRREHTCNPRAGTNPQPEEPFFNIQTSLSIIPTNENPFHFSSPVPNYNNNNNNSNNDQQQGQDSIFADYFPLSTTSVLDSSFDTLIPNLMHSSEFELSPVIAAITSGTNTPAFGTSFPTASTGTDSNFTFGHQGYYYP